MIFILISISMALFWLIIALRAARIYHFVKNTPTEDIQTASMGLTEIEGVVDEQSETVDTILPLKDEQPEPVYCSWEIEVVEPNEWLYNQQLNEIDTGKLIVSDETGDVEVDIDKGSDIKPLSYKYISEKITFPNECEWNLCYDSRFSPCTPHLL